MRVLKTVTVKLPSDLPYTIHGIVIGNWIYRYRSDLWHIVDFPSFPLVLQPTDSYNLRCSFNGRHFRVRYGPGHAVVAFMRYQSIARWVRGLPRRRGWPHDVRVSLIDGENSVLVDEIIGHVAFDNNEPIKAIWEIDGNQRMPIVPIQGGR